ncbi:VOC family protein [Micromonospora fluostatini]|uniref:VOC family protein n=1 Tax=Micromonospora sp. JCM 30529 TaxID=3421643 RepID=UPI003D165EBF
MIARFKDLCLDAADPRLLGAFWAEVLGGRLVDTGDGDARVDAAPPASPAESIWVNRVPEPRTGRTRVRLDLRLAEAGPERLRAAGARLVREPDSEIDWWVLADPEGNLFAALPARADTRPGPCHLVVDAADPAAQAHWWARALGGRADLRPADSAHPAGSGVPGAVPATGVASVVDAAGFPWQRWIFEPAPERRTVKNRMHWDVTLADPTPAPLIRHGATLLRERTSDLPWWIMADPEGNEFCAFPPDSPA